MTTSHDSYDLCNRVFDSVRTFDTAINELATQLRMDVNDPTLFRVASIIAGREIPEALTANRIPASAQTQTTKTRTTKAKRRSRVTSSRQGTGLKGRSMLLTPGGTRVDLTSVVHGVLRANLGRTMRPTDIVKTLRKSKYKYNGKNFSRSIADSLRRNTTNDIQRAGEGYVARA